MVHRAGMPAWWNVYQQWHRVRKRLGLHPSATRRRIVVGVGMHRTGTRSLARYLRSLGYRDVHWPWWCLPQAAPHAGDPAAMADLLEPLFYHYDCFTDVPFPALYRAVDQRFPDSRFILVRRDPASWWRSVSKHWMLDQRVHRLDPFEEVVYRQYSPPGLVLATKDDGPAWIGKFTQHCAAVEAYFAGRSDKLLVVDLEDGDLNFRISRFLDAVVRPYPLERSEEWP